MILNMADVVLAVQIHESNLVGIRHLDKFLVKFGGDSVRLCVPKNCSHISLEQHYIKKYKIVY